MRLRTVVNLLKTALVLLPLVGVASYWLRLGAHPTTAASTWLDSNTKIEIEVPPGDTPRLYSFSANPYVPTLLTLDTDTPGFAFATQVTDSDGQTVALLDSGSVQDVAVTLEPGVKLYHVALSSLSRLSGKVVLSVGDVIPVNVMPAPPDEPRATPMSVCGMVSLTDRGAGIYKAPTFDAEVLGVLNPKDMLVTSGKIVDGWFLAEVAGKQGWLSSGAVTLYGACDSVPLVLNPLIPAAPADIEPRVLEIDRDGSGRLDEAVSYPDGDNADGTWLVIVNLYNQPPNNYREVTLTMTCSGRGTQYLRWGAPDNPARRCGDSVVVPFLSAYPQQPILVLLPDGIPQSYVGYTLTASAAGRQA